MQKWKRRAHSQGTPSSSLATLSGQKRLVDEEGDLLSDLVVQKKGKHGVSSHKELAEVVSQPRQSL